MSFREMDNRRFSQDASRNEPSRPRFLTPTCLKFALDVKRASYRSSQTDRFTKLEPRRLLKSPSFRFAIVSNRNLKKVAIPLANLHFSLHKTDMTPRKTTNLRRLIPEAPLLAC